jgi:hypothetical protein
MAFHRALATGAASRLFGGGGAPALALLRAAWPHAVGHEVARRSRLVSLEGRTLCVRVPDAGWRRVLHRMQPEIVKRLQDLAGDLAPRRLGFSEGALGIEGAGEWSTRRAAADSRRPMSDGPVRVPAAVAAEAEAIDDLEIRAGFLRAAARYLSRQH